MREEFWEELAKPAPRPAARETCRCARTGWETAPRPFPRPAVAGSGVRDKPPGARRCGAAPLETQTCSDDGGPAWAFALALGFTFRVEPPPSTRSPEPLRDVAAGFRVDSICRCFETPSVRHSSADWRSEPTFFGIPARIFLYTEVFDM